MANVQPRLFRKILIANRGEIVLRIVRTCRIMGIKTCAVYSDADRHSMHAHAADEAVHIGGSAASESYLNMDVLIAAAKRVGADAIHPGYGFLSENAEFARRTIAAGIVFIGPKPQTMDDLGNKKAVKDLLSVRAKDVPLVPGYNGNDQSMQRLLKEAERIGFPLLIKAAAGGGGKGMRVVRELKEMESAVSSVKSEATNSFGNSQLLLERYFESCRHIEFQIMGDLHGNVIHLGERDCSVQRRYQKVIEETPSPFIKPDLRARMGKSAVTIAKLADYVGAGTVEFLVDQDSNYYFLEVNTRLQVEHPVTELVNGLDLVSVQIDVAQGKSLEQMGLLPHQRDVQKLREQKDIPVASIECRLYAEDPLNNFFPVTGPLLKFAPAKNMVGIRYDTGVQSGSTISVFYDPMVAKVISYGPSREIAIQRMVTALESTVVLGLRTNKSFLIDMLTHPKFQAGEYDTSFIGRYYPTESLKPPKLPRMQCNELAFVTCLYDWSRRRARRTSLRHIRSGWSNSLRKMLSSTYTLKTVSGSPRVRVHYRYDNSYAQSSSDTATPTGRARPHTFRMTVQPLTEDTHKQELAAKGTPKEKQQQQELEESTVRVSLLHCDLMNGSLTAEIDGVRREYSVAVEDDMKMAGQSRNLGVHDDDDMVFHVHSDQSGSHVLLRHSRFLASLGAATATGVQSVPAPIPCKILKLSVDDGAVVKKDDLVMVVESMKMEMKLYAEVGGQVKFVVKMGEVVKQDDILYTLSPPKKK